MATSTRGFFGRAHKERDPRLPPGQYDVGADWPVLTAEVTPRIVPERWSITVDGLVSTPTTWTWAEAHALPASRYEGDIHCVTTWSKLAHQLRRGQRGHPAGGGEDRFRGVASSWPPRRPGTPRTCRSPTSPAARPGWSGAHEGKPLPRRARRTGPDAGARTCTSGRARSGSPGSPCWTTISRASGSATATTTGAIRGWNRGIRVTDTMGGRRAAGSTTWAAASMDLAGATPGWAARPARATPPGLEAGADRALEDRDGWPRSATPRPRSVILRLDVPDRVDHLPGPALRGPAAGRRRVRRATVVLGRVPAVGSAGRAVGRAARGRRGVGVPGRRRRSRGRARGARPDRRLVRLGRQRCRPSGSPAAAVPCRWWRCSGMPRRSAGRSC